MWTRDTQRHMIPYTITNIAFLSNPPPNTWYPLSILALNFFHCSYIGRHRRGSKHSRLRTLSYLLCLRLLDLLSLHYLVTILANRRSRFRAGIGLKPCLISSIKSSESFLLDNFTVCTSPVMCEIVWDFLRTRVLPIRSAEKVRMKGEIPSATFSTSYNWIRETIDYEGLFRRDLF